MIIVNKESRILDFKESMIIFLAKKREKNL